MTGPAFKPQPIDAAMKERFKRVAAQPPMSPGQFVDRTLKAAAGQAPLLERDNIFDFESGLRMLVSKDDLLGIKALHLSFGYQDLRTHTPIPEETFIQETSRIIASLMERQDVLKAFKGPFSFHMLFRVNE